MKIIGKISIGFATLLSSGSCIYAIFNCPDWNSTIQKYLPRQAELPSVIPTGLRFLGKLVAQFPNQALDLAQSDHFYIRSLIQQVLALANYPQDFDIANTLKEKSDNTLISLARNPHTNEQYFDIGNEDAQKGENEKLIDALRHLLLSLPTNGQNKCTKWFTKSAFHGGKSGYFLYKTIFWGPGVEDHLNADSPDVMVPLFLKALRKHSEVPTHRSLIVENDGLDLLLIVAQSYCDNNTVGLVAHILGNLALDKTSHKAIIHKGWVRQLRTWANSKDIVIKSHSLRALANLDREGESGFTYEDGILVLHPVQQLKCCRPEVDLVFIHGLRGSPFKTWRSRNNKDDNRTRTDCWPREWIPVDVPQCRVILIEYDSELSDWTSKCPLQPEISELMRKLVKAGVGKRPVIWISHSMGGLLVKQLLVEASKSHDFSSLRTSTKGVVFYAVPHKGSDAASFASGKARYVLRPSLEVTELRKGSEVLRKLHQDFLNCIQKGDIDMLSYGETEPSRIVRDTLVVPRESADFGMGEFIQLPVNHCEVCKPTSRLDPCYVRTVLFVKEHMAKFDVQDYVSVLLF